MYRKEWGDVGTKETYVQWLELEVFGLRAVASAQRATNTGSPKLLAEMERFAVMCDRAGNGKDARCVRSWVKQLRAGA